MDHSTRHWGIWLAAAAAHLAGALGLGACGEKTSAAVLDPPAEVQRRHERSAAAAAAPALRNTRRSTRRKRPRAGRPKAARVHEHRQRAALAAKHVTPPAPPAPTDEEEVGLFFGVDDEAVREALRSQPIAKIKRGRGGRSLGFKITLADGTKGYYKPEQSFSAANWFAEVAAYHLDRELGIGRVPPVVSRRMAWKPLRRAAGRDKRRKEVTVRRDGTVRGAFVWWIPGGLRTMPNWKGWERWVRNRHWPSTAVTPFQRPRVWKARLDRRKELGDEWLTKQERERRRNQRPRPDRPDRAAELSDLIVFDYLIRNIDRWGGNNANVLIRGKRGPLVFLDNGAGFAPGPDRPSLMEARLHVIQRFRRPTIEAVRNFDMEAFKARLAAEPLAPILSKRLLAGLRERMGALLRWVGRMERRFGEKRVYPWDPPTPLAEDPKAGPLSARRRRDRRSASL